MVDDIKPPTPKSNQPKRPDLDKVEDEVAHAFDNAPESPEILQDVPEESSEMTQNQVSEEAEMPEQAQQETVPQQPAPVENKPVKTKSNKTTLAIVVAILFALAIIGAGYYVFSQQSETDDANNEATDTSIINEDANLPPEEVTGDSVDSEVEEIDSLIDSLDEETDFPSSELSDETLGL